MARNHKFYFESDGTPKARGPATERILMAFLEMDVQGSDHVCHDLMDDITAIEDGSDDLREFNGNFHSVSITGDGITIDRLSGAAGDSAAGEDAASEKHYSTALKHFREILEDWEAFILDDQLDDPMRDDEAG